MHRGSTRQKAASLLAKKRRSLWDSVWLLTMPLESELLSLPCPKDGQFGWIPRSCPVDRSGRSDDQAFYIPPISRVQGSTHACKFFRFSVPS
jgi:hypothetical protein